MKLPPQLGFWRMAPHLCQEQYGAGAQPDEGQQEHQGHLCGPNGRLILAANHPAWGATGIASLRSFL